MLAPHRQSDQKFRAAKFPIYCRKPRAASFLFFLRKLVGQTAGQYIDREGEKKSQKSYHNKHPRNEAGYKKTATTIFTGKQYPHEDTLNWASFPIRISEATVRGRARTNLPAHLQKSLIYTSSTMDHLCYCPPMDHALLPCEQEGTLPRTWRTATIATATPACR